MTVMIAPTRALAAQLLPSARHLHAARFTGSILRVNPTNDTDHQAPIHVRTYRKSCIFPQARFYATSAPSKAGRPKAHTGRATASTRKPSGTKAASTVRKAASPTNGNGANGKAAKKKKTTVKAAAKPKVKKAPSEKAKERAVKLKATQENRLLKEKALLSPPKTLPGNAWQVVFTETMKGRSKTDKVGDTARKASQLYKSLTPEERETYNHIGNQNKAKNESIYRDWIHSFTPLQIKEANNARNLLTRHAKAAGKRKQGFSHIQDDRLVKQPNNPYSLFFTDRFASGDMKGMKVPEVGGLVGREWKALTEAQRKPFEDKAAAERKRYEVEFRSVYGMAPPSAAQPTVSA